MQSAWGHIILVELIVRLVTKIFFFFFTENIRREERISHQKWCFHRELAEANLEHFKTCPFLIQIIYKNITDKNP